VAAPPQASTSTVLKSGRKVEGVMRPSWCVVHDGAINPQASRGWRRPCETATDG
jgi:hypothetical protein